MRVFRCGIGGVYFEAFGDAVRGDFDRVAVLFAESAIGEGGVEEVDNGKREALLSGSHVCGMDDVGGGKEGKLKNKYRRRTARCFGATTGKEASLKNNPCL